jgi:hypothetical protein
MLRERTWLFRHACSNTQIGAQNARQKLVAQTVIQRPATVHRFAANGRLPSFSSLAEQEEAPFDIIDDISNNFRSSSSTASPNHATWPHRKFTDPHPTCHERQPPVPFEPVSPKQTRIPHTTETKSNSPSLKPIRSRSHRDCPMWSY